MYPNLYYVFKDWFGVDWKALSFLNTFGLMVALSFVGGALAFASELKRQEKLGWQTPREESITVGKKATITELLMNAIAGFLFGYKIIGLLFDKPPEINAQDYIFSSGGNLLGGILAALLLAGLKWREKDKNKLKEPEIRTVRIWPHDRVGDFVILGLVFGIIGAKIFDNLENIDEFIKDPIGRFFSASGLTFYGGLIVASIVICVYAYKKGINVRRLVDAAAPGLMIAYAIGRIGCQVSGDGDWGIYNSAYTSDPYGNVFAADPTGFKSRLEKDSTYFLAGKILDSNGTAHYVTDRYYASLDDVPHKAIKGPSFLPNSFFAYSYPQNVNKDGIRIPGNLEEHNRVLPQPVFPSSLYETIICTLLFLFLWSIRKRIKTPLVMFGIYLILNGIERFFIEMIRVNRLYDILGMSLSQAEIIALSLVIFGTALIFISRRKWANS